MTNYIHNIKSVNYTSNVYRNNQTLNSVDLNYVPYENNDMLYAFYNCQNLQYVSNINENITSLYSTFDRCVNIKSVTIPNSVTNMASTFSGCRNNLTDTPIIPNSVTNMFYTFCDCHNLKKC